jgi:hypothetical protein
MQWQMVRAASEQQTLGACIKSLQGQGLSFAQQTLFRHDLKLILTTLEAAPSVHLLFEPIKIASIADGALHVDTDAPSTWGLGAVLFTEDKAYCLYEEWAEKEKAIFDIAELEAIAYDLAFKSFPAVAPSHFTRKQLVGRIDSEVARFAFQGLRTSKGKRGYRLLSCRSLAIPSQISFPPIHRQSRDQG